LSRCTCAGFTRHPLQPQPPCSPSTWHHAAPPAPSAAGAAKGTTPHPRGGTGWRREEGRGCHQRQTCLQTCATHHWAGASAPKLLPFAHTLRQVVRCASMLQRRRLPPAGASGAGANPLLPAHRPALATTATGASDAHTAPLAAAQTLLTPGTTTPAATKQSPHPSRPPAVCSSAHPSASLLLYTHITCCTSDPITCACGWPPPAIGWTQGGPGGGSAQLLSLLWQWRRHRACNCCNAALQNLPAPSLPPAAACPHQHTHVCRSRDPPSRPTHLLGCAGGSSPTAAALEVPSGALPHTRHLGAHTHMPCGANTSPLSKQSAATC
jgi:hypothetical protein